MIASSKRSREGQISLPRQLHEEESSEYLRRDWKGKRSFDFALSAALLVVFSPVLFIASLVIVLSSKGGSPFFTQVRIGQGGREFKILKLRTMVKGAEQLLEANGELRTRYLNGDHKISCISDPRVTRVGGILRKTSIDELPQLLNVLAGHMSLVGPRPVRPSELPCYGDLASSYLALRPGMSGLWQVSGRSTIVFPERAEIDHRYLLSNSLWQDLNILTKTPVAVVKGVGAH